MSIRLGLRPAAERQQITFGCRFDQGLVPDKRRQFNPNVSLQNAIRQKIERLRWLLWMYGVLVVRRLSRRAWCATKKALPRSDPSSISGSGFKPAQQSPNSRAPRGACKSADTYDQEVQR